jgi:hypothetical protein
MFNPIPRLIFLLGCGYTLGHPCLQGGVLELPLSLGQGMVPARLSVLCELGLKRVVHLHLVIVCVVRDVGTATAARVHQVLCDTEEMVRRHKSCKLPSVSSVWAVLTFSNGTRGLKKAKTQLMTICGLADRWQVKLMTVLHKCKNWSTQIGA